jgi:septum formation protein
MLKSPLSQKFPYIILASQSPRRAELLRQIGIEFKIRPGEIEEPGIVDRSSADAVKDIALTKARAVAKTVDKGLVIAADTTVVIDRQAIGKPENDAHAIEILRRLSGNVHEVITGVALIDLDRACEMVWAEKTTVYFRRLRESEILDYVRSGDASDKAGAYGIQGGAAAFVERVEGCYFNVVGLPLASLVERLWQLAEV